jgi:hypothetical protein
MVTMTGILNILNILSIFFININVLETWVVVSNNYSGLKLIVSLLLLFNSLFIIFFNIKYSYIQNFIVHPRALNLFIFVTLLYSGLLMCGLSVLGLVLGMLCLGISLSNLFYVVFEIESTDTRTVHPSNEQFENSRTYHPTISNECCVDEENTDNI